jgi:DNA excision repair protein ERCC-2
LEDGRIKIKLYCVETARNLREYLDKGNSAVFFSATLLPMPYYKHLLGDEEDYAIYAHSPFSQENRLLLVARDVSSRYSRRGAREYERIAAYINQTVESHPGNYLVFFPSYKMLQEVVTVYEHQFECSEVRCLVQRAGMGEREREEFLEQFARKPSGEGLLGFCIMGGIFSEGIDLKREALIGSVIVGTGLPQVCGERELLRQFYEDRGMEGFAYAYQYPGMNKVQQAAGRVIRTQEDRGVILLLDERFTQISYQRLFPREWERHQVCRLGELTGYLEEFWGGAEGLS